MSSACYKEITENKNYCALQCCEQLYPPCPVLSALKLSVPPIDASTMAKGKKRSARLGVDTTSDVSSTGASDDVTSVDESTDAQISPANSSVQLRTLSTGKKIIPQVVADGLKKLRDSFTKQRMESGISFVQLIVAPASQISISQSFMFASSGGGGAAAQNAVPFGSPIGPSSDYVVLIDSKEDLPNLHFLECQLSQAAANSPEDAEQLFEPEFEFLLSLGRNWSAALSKLAPTIMGSINILSSLLLVSPLRPLPLICCFLDH